MRDHASLVRAAEELRYNRTVFIAPPWREIYANDTERKQDWAESVATHDAMVLAYEALGYDLVPLPLGPESRTMGLRLRFSLIMSAALEMYTREGMMGYMLDADEDSLTLKEDGGLTVYHPTGKTEWIYDAAMKYRETGTPLVILAGKMYGAGSSRDWAAKGTYLLGVKAVIAENFERIHRSNLVEMGVLPCEFTAGQTAESLGLTGTETYTLEGIGHDLVPHKHLKVTATAADGKVTKFDVRCRIDSAIEIEYYRHGGIMQYVIRSIMAKAKA